MAHDLILVVEDDPALRNLIERQLQNRGFRTAGAASGGEALAWLEVNSPRLMLLDYSLPDMSGEELVARLRSRGRDVPFVVATGHAGESIASEMMRLDARDYLVKNGALIDVLPTTVEKTIARLPDEDRPGGA
jgi:CheY-like chemotaxis protein